MEKFGYQTATYWLLKEKKNFLQLHVSILLTKAFFNQKS